MMFAPFCPTHHSKVLMTRRSVLSFWNGPDGPVIRWKCTCGHEGFLDRNGDEAACVTADTLEEMREKVTTLS
jgi:hypothetical protein